MPSQPQICGGELGEDKSFYFRSPDGALDLQAQNLAFFLQIAEGIDDLTWLRHLRAGDYSQWLRDKIKDGELADAVASAEKDEGLTPSESRRRIKEAIERRLHEPRVASTLSKEMIARRITHRDHVTEKLLDGGLPAEPLCMRAAELARYFQRCHGGRSKVPLERTGAAVADDVQRSGNRQCRHRNPAGQRLEQHQTERLGSARQHERIRRCVVPYQRFALLTSGKVHIGVAPLHFRQQVPVAHD
jgi:hypothetical protein